jgi:serine phosphatase RsbU (regulator of sigma subunit)
VEAMVAIRQVIRVAAYQGLDPAQTLAHANRFLRRYDPHENATALFGLLNTRERSFVFANAGHPPPIMAGPVGSLFLEFPDSDLPLGIETELVPALRRISVPAATLFVLYTDGVSEREKAPLLGEKQLHAATRYAYRSAASMTAEVIEQQLRLGGSNSDDAAILTARTPLSPIFRKSRASRRMDRQEFVRSGEDMPRPRGSIMPT